MNSFEYGSYLGVRTLTTSIARRRTLLLVRRCRRIVDHNRFDVKSSVTDVDDGVRVRQNRRRAAENFTGRQRFRLREKNISDVIFQLFFDQLKRRGKTVDRRTFSRRRTTNLERTNELNRADQGQFTLRVEMMFQRLDDVLDVHLDIDEDVQNTDARRLVNRNCKSTTNFDKEKKTMSIDRTNSNNCVRNESTSHISRLERRYHRCSTPRRPRPP